MTYSIVERHRIILEKLNEKGYVNVHDLSQELRVSSVTIRKDLKVLEDRNMLFRTHGSATLKNPYINERPVNEKEKVRVEEKRNITKAAINLLDAQDRIIIASGTTVNTFAGHIPANLSLTVLTASLKAAEMLSRNTSIEVMQLGGTVRQSSASVIGPFAESMLNEFYFNKLFMGVDGIDPTYGLTTTSGMEASLNKAMIEASQKVIVLADASKFGRRGFGRICGLEKVDMVVTDSLIDNKYQKAMEDHGIEVIIG